MARILMYSINPLFADRVIGGSTKHLQNIAIHLGELGHHVTILCTGRLDNQAPFHWHPNVQIKPWLNHKQPFPQPYDMPHYQIANNIQLIGDHLAQADRFYVHDGELLYPDLYNELPTIVSLRDNAYPETKLGTFLFDADALLPISAYSARVVRATAGRFRPAIDERIRTIPNGIDWQRFSPTEPSEELLHLIGIDPRAFTVVLHPHRPEINKGMQQTVAVVDQLVHNNDVSDLRVLVPRWFDAVLSHEVADFYKAIEAEISQRGLTEHFVFHEWIPQRLMHEYFSLGAVTLALGSFVEAFGNAAYESLGCGTPSIVARVGPYRDQLPDELHDKVHFDDNEGAAALAAEIIYTGRRTSEETHAYLQAHFSIEQQLPAYAEAILDAQKLPAAAYQYTASESITAYKLAPWCYASVPGVFFHDFNATHESLPALADLLDSDMRVRVPTNGGHAQRALIEDLYQRGFLVPEAA